MTTSIPEAPAAGATGTTATAGCATAISSCNALNRLGATRTMERYLGYIVNIAAGRRTAACSRCTASTAAPSCEEREVDSLPGYRGMGPVRVGNQAYRQVQHDVYGSAILAATHVFFDQRLVRCGDEALFHRLEAARRARRAGASTSPTPACGSCAAARACTPFPASCAGPPATAWRRSPSGSDWRERARLLARAGRAHPPRRLRAGLERQRQQLRRHLRRQLDGRQPAAAGRSRLPAGRRSALRRHGRGRRARRCATATSSSATSRRTISARPRTPSWSAPSGTSMRWPRSAAATRRARCSSACSPAATATACWPSTSTRSTRRAMGQLRADLQHGRADQFRDPSQRALGPGLLTRQTLDAFLAAARKRHG